jgi:hypothetical protein
MVAKRLATPLIIRLKDFLFCQKTTRFFMMSPSEKPGSDFEPAYRTNLRVFTEERAKRLAGLKDTPALRGSFPSNINSGMTWYGDGLNPDTYILKFSNDELGDINQACAKYNRKFGRTSRFLSY